MHAGQKVVLTGFNGVGKSTLLNTLAGRLPPLAGRFRSRSRRRWAISPRPWPGRMETDAGGAGDRPFRL